MATDIFQGEPAIKMTLNGATLVYIGGQPVMDTGIENQALFALFTAKGWAGNFLLPPESQIGSDFEKEAREAPITISSMARLEKVAENALKAPIFGKVTAVASNPESWTKAVNIRIEPPGGVAFEINLVSNGQNWINQAENPAHVRTVQTDPPPPNNSIVINGYFITDSDWGKDPGWSIDTVNERAVCDGTQVAETDLSQVGSMIAGANYRIKIVYTRTAGAARFVIEDHVNGVGVDWDIGETQPDTTRSSCVDSNDEYTLSNVNSIGSGDKLLKTTNGIDWDEISTGLLNTDSIACFAWNGTKWMFIYRRGSAYYSTTSTDLITFTVGVVIGTVFINDIATDGTDWCLCSNNTSPNSKIYHSIDDGATWTPYNSGKAFHLNGITHNGTVWCSVGGADGVDAFIITFADPTGAYTEQANPKNFGLNDVDKLGTLLVAVGDADGTDSYLVTSADNGATWTERSNSRNYNLRGVDGSSGNIIVAVGQGPGNLGDYITTSADNGITWTERVFSAFPDASYLLNDATYRNNVLIAGGAELVASAPVGCKFYVSGGDTWSNEFTGASGSVEFNYTALNTDDTFNVRGDTDFTGTVDSVEMFLIR